VRSTLYARIIELVGSHDIDTRLNAVKLLYALLMAAGVYEPELRSIWSRHELTRRLRVRQPCLRFVSFRLVSPRAVASVGGQRDSGRILELSLVHILGTRVNVRVVDDCENDRSSLALCLMLETMGR